MVAMATVEALLPPLPLYCDMELEGSRATLLLLLRNDRLRRCPDDVEWPPFECMPLLMLLRANVGC